MTEPHLSSAKTADYLEIEGFIDHLYANSVDGWVWDEFDPAATVHVDIYDDERLLTTIAADVFRDDLLEAGKGDGRHGFIYQASFDMRRESAAFRVRVSGTDVELLEAPRRAERPAADVDDPPLAMVRATGHPSVETFLDHGKDVACVCRLYGRLRPSGRVLDVGCGVGRLAIPLTTHLKNGGLYEGFDVTKDTIAWCTEYMSSKHPNFHFQHADIRNRYYNPNGRFSASEYRFPYADGSFDVVFLGSVFTHLLPAEMEHYLAEIARVLKPGGRSLISYFVLDGGTLKHAADKILDFAVVGDGYRTTNPTVPEAAVAYEEKFIRQLHLEHGLSIVEPIHFGEQGLVVAARRS